MSLAISLSPVPNRHYATLPESSFQAGVHTGASYYEGGSPPASTPRLPLQPAPFEPTIVRPTTENPGVMGLGMGMTLTGVTLAGAIGVGAAFIPAGFASLLVAYVAARLMGSGLGLASAGAAVLAVHLGRADAYGFLMREGSAAFLMFPVLVVAIGIVTSNPLLLGLGAFAGGFASTALAASACARRRARPSLLSTLQFWQRLVPFEHARAAVDIDAWGLHDRAARTVNKFLWRVTATQDYKTGGFCRARLAVRVMELFTAMEQDTQLNDVCVDMMYHSFTSCGDGTMLSMNQLEIAVRIHKAMTSDDSEQALMRLAKSIIKLEAVREHVLILAAQHRWTDMVEYQLAFETQLAEPLELPVSAAHMLYPAMAHIEMTDLQGAIQSAVAAVGDTDDVNAFLRTWAPWQQHLRKKHALSHSNWLELPEHPFDVAEGDAITCPLTQESHAGVVQPIIFRSGSKLYMYEHAEFLTYWVQTGQHLDQNGMREKLETLDGMQRIASRSQGQIAHEQRLIDVI